MNDILKQRLVGALILVALGVVFWPIIFVEPGERSSLEQSRIPPPPMIDTTPIEAPTQEGLRASADWEIVEDAEDSEEPVLRTEEESAGASDGATKSETTAVAKTDAAAAGHQTRTMAPEKPVLDDKGVPVAWILQVASVSSAAKAEELRAQLLAKQEKAYVKKLERGGKNLYRVYIGPNFERAKLERIQAAINSQFGVKSMIVRYIP